MALALKAQGQPQHMTLSLSSSSCHVRSLHGMHMTLQSCRWLLLDPKDHETGTTPSSCYHLALSSGKLRAHRCQLCPLPVREFTDPCRAWGLP